MKNILFLAIACGFLLALPIERASAQTEDSPALPLYAPKDNPWANLHGFDDLFSNDIFTGEMRFEVPFPLLPGRNNVTPELMLTYSSFKKDFLSPYGYGWDLSVSSIFRTSRKGVSAMYVNNEFGARIAGTYNELTLVDASSGLYMGKFGNDFTKYFFEGNQWRVQDTKGVTYYFGAVDSSRQDDPHDTSRVFQWMLTKREDSNGNKIEYTYFKDQGQIYLDAIEYVFNDMQSLYRVDFEYMTKSNSAKSYQTGFAVATNFLL
ncbi:MAG: hypothetical protein A3C04_03245 [Candidatus Wildermuthbacteria bacterium RIFCSPHIGHO2_02_FULL_45_25]|uniref:Uncharacterized protein n=1 Tax=Candidatus Wildermuthbacteria bacterium RIFCSPHIGHO2_02_FULL_45_25 TaxID=1802450 RepID=A0A1G2R3W6_9BACT|nr:MAG: hypothetical protein A3C04_03245 [Candidatus Wildermuthbacteria bacterium RIFCSPHIGHO2_02_FULL_45_25]